MRWRISLWRAGYISVSTLWRGSDAQTTLDDNISTAAANVGMVPAKHGVQAPYGAGGRRASFDMVERLAQRGRALSIAHHVTAITCRISFQKWTERHRVYQARASQAKMNSAR